ncbi:cilia- and flagella-associated protein 276 isoform X2 [Chaetodon auriga]|uniref:cilia- and flagella-associated protein 276 isoform X2 n=1 Tax=Chaetodon auriga TaxID=39042 RepID=UPI004032F0BB
MSGRDPFPSPKLENGFTLSGFRTQQRKTFNKPTHIAQMEEPWSRLHDSATLASTRRSVTHHEHQDFFWRKNQILYQKETISEEQRKQENLKQDMLEKEQQKDIRVWVDPQKCSIYSIK